MFKMVMCLSFNNNMINPILRGIKSNLFYAEGGIYAPHDF